MKHRRNLLLGLAVVASLGGLAACSGPYTIAADVTTFGEWPAGRQGASYAFERLPSQKLSKRQGELEASASAALEKAGFKLAADAKAADILVNVGARVSATEYAPWDDPLWWRWRGSFGGWRYSTGPWRGSPFGLGTGFPVDRRYDREVAMLMRDRASNEPLYEARASHESFARGDGTVTAALFQAALADFPKVQPETHRVLVQAER